MLHVVLFFHDSNLAFEYRFYNVENGIETTFLGKLESQSFG